MTNASQGQVVVLAGGLSPERDVSIRSGRRVADALRVVGVDATVLDVDATLLATLGEQEPACVVPLLHGAPGEDGAIRDVLVALDNQLNPVEERAPTGINPQPLCL